jgi:DNA-binding GntR family transcriptional regulator
MIDALEETQQPSSTNLIRTLENEILNNVLKPGDRLDEQTLARRFKVSRTPVREALRHLASSGLVEIRKNQGAAVKRLTTAELIEMFQVIAELEGLSARLCARRMSADELVELRQRHEECAAKAEARDHEAFFLANNVFHDVIFRGSHNTFLQVESRKLRNRVNVYRWRITFQPRRMQRSVVEHARIVEAIEAGDEEAADRLMREHVDFLAGSAADVLVALEAESRK